MNSDYIEKQILPRFSNKYYLTAEPEGRLLDAIVAGKKRFPLRGNTDFFAYSPKDMMRYLLAKKHFPEAFEGSIADIGDREGVIKRLAKGDVRTLDKNNPELDSFDWDLAPLPFSDRQFTSVFCLDTLEHISKFHDAFADLLRITSKYAVISLPNCWKKGVKEMVLGRGFQSSYGLPLEKPIDRHHWFMNTEDIEDFIHYNAEKLGFSVESLIYFAPRVAWWHFMLPALAHLLPDYYFKNLFVQNVFVKLKRK